MAAALTANKDEQLTMLIATSEPRGYLRAGVLLIAAELLVPGNGHAEQDVVDFVERNAMTLLAIGATRPICPDCADAIERTGAAVATELRSPKPGR